MSKPLLLASESNVEFCVDDVDACAIHEANRLINQRQTTTAITIISNSQYAKYIVLTRGERAGH